MHACLVLGWSVKSADNPNPVRQNRWPSGAGDVNKANKHTVTTNLQPETDKYYSTTLSRQALVHPLYTDLIHN